jgi:hypothetical protein
LREYFDRAETVIGGTIATRDRCLKWFQTVWKRADLVK